MVTRSKRGVCCPGPQPGDLSPRGRQREPCGRDKDGEGGVGSVSGRDTESKTGIETDSVGFYVCKKRKRESFFSVW